MMSARRSSPKMAARSHTHQGIVPSDISEGNTSVVTWWVCQIKDMH